MAVTFGFVGFESREEMLAWLFRAGLGAVLAVAALVIGSAPLGVLGVAIAIGPELYYSLKNSRRLPTGGDD